MSYTEKAPISLLLADDHSLIRQGIIFMLEDLPFDTFIHQAPDLQKTMEIIKANPVDIIIIDAHFPDGNSLSILPQIKKIRSEAKILVFTGIDENMHALKFIDAGADGFLSKLSEEEEIKRAIIKIKEDGEYISPATQALLMSSVRDRKLINPLFGLTDRELQIAELYSKGYGNLEIANLLDLKQNTISTLKKRIFNKLKIDNIVELIELVKNHQ